MPPKYKLVCERGQCSHQKLLPGNPYLTRREVESDEEEEGIPRFRISTYPFEDNDIKRFDLPEPILAKIVSYASEEGIDALHSWILSGREGVAACHSEETLSRVRLDKSPFFVWMSRPRSGYFRFYCKCLKARNPFAVYVESIKRAFVCLDLEGAIGLTIGVKDENPLAELLYIVLNSCAGHEDLDVYYKFKKKYWRLSELNQMTDALVYHINKINPRRCGTFLPTWTFSDVPECYDLHIYEREFNGERCLQCIFFYLSLEIAELS